MAARPAAALVVLVVLGVVLVASSLRPTSEPDPLYDERNATGSCYGYPSVEEAHAFFAAMAQHILTAQGAAGGGAVAAAAGGLAKYPINIGTSNEGRPLEALCLGYRCEFAAGNGGGGNGDAASGEPSDAAVPQALFTGLHHAREPTSLGVLYYFVRDLVRKYVAGDAPTRLLLHSRQLWFLPIVNPDGYAANCRGVQGQMVRTNMRPACTRKGANRGPGVDLNRNYPVCWERATQDHSASTRPCSEDYHGTVPFSEPETAAIRDLTGRQNFTFAINYHSYGKEITYPYGCKVLGKPKGNDYDIFIGIGKRITDLNGFMYGVGWEKPLDLYTVSGAAQDWMFRERGIYALMSEVGPLYHKGQPMKPAFWPTPDAGRAIAEENIEANTKMAWLSGPFLELADHHINYNPGGAPGEVRGVTVEVLNAGIMPATHWSVRAYVARKDGNTADSSGGSWDTVDAQPAFWRAQPRAAATPYRKHTVDLVAASGSADGAGDATNGSGSDVGPTCEAGSVMRFILLAMTGEPSSLVKGKTCVRYEVDCTSGKTTGPEICDKNLHNLILRDAARAKLVQ